MSSPEEQKRLDAEVERRVTVQHAEIEKGIYPADYRCGPQCAHNHFCDVTRAAAVLVQYIGSSTDKGGPMTLNVLMEAVRLQSEFEDMVKVAAPEMYAERYGRQVG